MPTDRNAKTVPGGVPFPTDTTTRENYNTGAADSQDGLAQGLFGKDAKVAELPTGYCTKGSGVIYSEKLGRAFPAPCKRWRRCERCRAYIARRFTKQLWWEVNEAGGWFGWVTVERDRWGAMLKWVGRHGLRYRAIPLGADRLVVLTKHHDGLYPTGELPQTNVETYIYRWLCDVPTDRRPSATQKDEETGRRGFGGPYAGMRGSTNKKDWAWTHRGIGEVTGIVRDALLSREHESIDEVKAIVRTLQPREAERRRKVEWWGFGEVKLREVLQ